MKDSSPIWSQWRFRTKYPGDITCGEKGATRITPQPVSDSPLKWCQGASLSRQVVLRKNVIAGHFLSQLWSKARGLGEVEGPLAAQVKMMIGVCVCVWSVMCVIQRKMGYQAPGSWKCWCRESEMGGSISPSPTLPCAQKAHLQQDLRTNTYPMYLLLPRPSAFQDVSSTAP